MNISFPFFVFMEVVKLASGIAQYIERTRNESYANILNKVHQRVINKIKMQQKKEKAQEIQSALQALKGAIFRIHEFNKTLEFSGLSSIEIFYSEIDNLMFNIFNQQISLYNNKSKKSYDTFLQRKHTSQKTALGDDIVEEEIAILLSLGSTSFNAGDIVVGGNQDVSSIIKNLTEEEKKKIQESIIKLAEKKGKQIQRKNKAGKLESIISTNVTVRSGKTDISVPAEIELNANAHPMIQKITKAMAGYNFSIKNYTSMSYIDGQNELKDFQKTYLNFSGSGSNIFKAVTGGLYEYTNHEDVIEAIYYRGVQYLTGNTIPPDTTNYENVNNHFAHLRTIYQLKGSGIINESGQTMAVDFVIWNDPSSQFIYVRDVNTLILNCLENNLDIFGRVRMSFENFKNSV